MSLFGEGQLLRRADWRSDHAENTSRPFQDEGQSRPASLVDRETVALQELADRRRPTNVAQRAQPGSRKGPREPNRLRWNWTRREILGRARSDRNLVEGTRRGRHTARPERQT